MEQLRAQLIEKSQECQVLKTELKDKDETIEDLEKRMKEQEERYWDDVSARNLIVVRLRKEVQEKSSTVARLSALLRAQTGREPEKVGTCKLATARTRWDSKGLLPNETTGNLYRKLMDFGPASNRNLSVPTSSQPSSISRQILDKYCRLSQPSYLPNVNVPKRQQQQQPPPSELPGTDTHNRKPQTLQIRKNFVERRLDRDLVNNVRPWADPQLINADGPSTT